MIDVLCRLFLLLNRNRISLESLKEFIAQHESVDGKLEPWKDFELDRHLVEYEFSLIRHALAEGGNLVDASKLLGIRPRSLRSRMEARGASLEQYRAEIKRLSIER